MHKLASGFGDMLQYSVYACLLTPARRVELATRIRNTIDLQRDRVIVLDLGAVRTGHDWIPPLEAFGAQALPVSRSSIIT
jgi:CRISPR-associated endonuclease Cas2